MMRRTRSLVSRLMEGLSLQVRDTVEGETPAAAATSLMVTAIVCSSSTYKEINFPLKASPGRGKLSPQVTDEGADKQQLTGNYPSSGAARHLPPKG